MTFQSIDVTWCWSGSQSHLVQNREKIRVAELEPLEHPIKNDVHVRNVPPKVVVNWTRRSEGSTMRQCTKTSSLCKTHPPRGCRIGLGDTEIGQYGSDLLQLATLPSHTNQ